MAKRIIVDKNDTIIGAKLRDEMIFGIDLYRVSALWLTNSRNQILLAQRSLSLHNGAGLWGPAVAGTVEEGETYETNIYKEAYEEIGLQDVIFEKSQKIFIEGERPYFCQYFTATLNYNVDKFILDPNEVNAVQWIEPDLLKKDLRMQPEKYIHKMNQVIQLFLS